MAKQMYTVRAIVLIEKFFEIDPERMSPEFMARMIVSYHKFPPRVGEVMEPDKRLIALEVMEGVHNSMLERPVCQDGAMCMQPNRRTYQKLTTREDGTVTLDFAHQYVEGTGLGPLSDEARAWKPDYELPPRFSVAKV